MLPLLSLGENTGVQNNRRDKAKAGPSQPPPVQRGDSSSSDEDHNEEPRAIVTDTLEDEDRPTASERFGVGPEPFFRENPASLVETDFYLIAPSVPVQGWSFNIGFAYRPNLLVTEDEYVGTSQFYETFRLSEEEYQKVLAIRLDDLSNED